MSYDFVHLHLHSEYSIVDGMVRLDPLIETVATEKIPAVALTDFSNLFGMVKFYKAALAQGVKPIIGADFWLENVKKPLEPFLLVLLCQNEKGYKNLVQLISKAYVENQVHDRPITRYAWLNQFNEGLIALSGALAGDIGQALLHGKQEEAIELIEQYRAWFPDRFYLELQRTNRLYEKEYIEAALNLAEEYQLPVVATNDVRFLTADDFEAHEARFCIHEGVVLSDARRPHPYSEQQYFRSAAEMAELFADIPSALQNTVEIAKRCSFRLRLGEIFLPHFPVPDNFVSIEEYLEAQAKKGLEERLREMNKEVDVASYQARLQWELSTINSMGFAGYFLIVADFINWAKRNDIPVGPGRGSGAGSLVAYVLHITDLDPITLDLLFERFLNPERISMPDFDIDFCMDGRDRVIEYVAHKYGRESVSQIITYGTMAARAVVRDVGRVLGYSYGFVDKIAKLIPFELGITLDKALAAEELLQARYQQEEEVRTLIDLAKKLEGITRNAGKHAGGVVISPSKLTDFTPLFCEPNGQTLVTQFDKDDIEAVGLVKFDFLGLRTLTIIHHAVLAINRERLKRGEKLLDIRLLPLDDAKTFALLKSCKTTAVFQLESRGLKELIKRLVPDQFEEIIALVALYRPGPLQSGMVDDFINRKHGRARVEYLHPKVASILKSTYGVILYQEQVMQIAQVLAGYTLGQADLLRKAMGKKQVEVMAEQRETFIVGAAKHSNIDRDTAMNIFNLMEKFAGYGFNRSHSAAYALISYQTAWLKAHYPAEFMAAVLSSDMNNTDKVVMFIEECLAMKLTVLPPSINRSRYAFVVEDGAIVYGLGAIKGVGEAAIQAIITERESKGLFRNLFDFCRRVDLRKVNRRMLEALIRSGAMDDLGPHRAALLETLASAVAAADQYNSSSAQGQYDLFGDLLNDDDVTNATSVKFIVCPIWSDEKRLAGEKETLGFYLSGHPLDRYSEELKRMATNSIAVLRSHIGKTDIIAGLITGIRIIYTKRGDRIAFVTVNDRTGRIDVSVFDDLFSSSRELLQEDQPLVVEGEVVADEYTDGYKITAKKLMSIEQARTTYAKHLLLTLKQDALDPQLITKLKQIFEVHRGSCPVCIAYKREGAEVLLPLSKSWMVAPTDDLLLSLQETFPKFEAIMVY